MGCSTSRQDIIESSINKQIESSQKLAQEQAKAQIDLIILGTGDSGKTSEFESFSAKSS